MESLKVKQLFQLNREKLVETQNLFNNQSQSSIESPNLISSKIQTKEDNVNWTQKHWYSGLNNNDFLSQCEQFIMQHSNRKQKQGKKKPVNFNRPKYQVPQSQQCQWCKIYHEKQLEWMNQKLSLQRMIKQLQQKLCNQIRIAQIQKQQYQQKLSFNKKQKQNKQSKLSITNEVFTLNVYEQFQSYLTKSRTFSQETMSTMQSQLSPSQLITDKQVFLQSLKSYNEKLQQTQSQNKYLKIQNYTLMKTKTEIQTIKKQMQKTKSQRDMFKKKLVSLNNNDNKKYSRENNTRENNQHTRLKQRKAQNKLNQELFELSLTDSHSNGHSCNNNNICKVKKIQRPQFIQQRHK